MLISHAGSIFSHNSERFVVLKKTRSVLWMLENLGIEVFVLYVIYSSVLSELIYVLVVIFGNTSEVCH